MAALLTIRDLKVTYRVRGRAPLTAVAGASLDISPASTLALIGESGSGKSTIARAICGFVKPAGGSIVVDGRDLVAEPNQSHAAGRSGIQIVFQDSTSSLDPRWPIWKSIAEPRFFAFRESMDQHRRRALDLLERVGLPKEYGDRRPHQLSGGQRQRVTIARALSSEPRIVILDEAVSALDVSVRNEILTLLDELKRERHLTYLFISHDMGAVAQMATHVAVLYLGKIVELGDADRVIRQPAHPYTRALIAAVPTIEVKRRTAPVIGEMDDPGRPPPGCRFHRRCPYAVEKCKQDEPVERPYADRLVACHRAEEIEQQIAI
jgi:oligopeptide/dipeptide ABC transporter ATP-binding protein